VSAITGSGVRHGRITQQLAAHRINLFDVNALVARAPDAQAAPNPAEVRSATDWLREQRSIEEYQREKQDKVELWILLLVAIEAVSSLLDAGSKIFQWLTQLWHFICKVV
jgi:hypothetical protein